MAVGAGGRRVGERRRRGGLALDRSRARVLDLAGESGVIIHSLGLRYTPTVTGGETNPGLNGRNRRCVSTDGWRVRLYYC